MAPKAVTRQVSNFLPELGDAMGSWGLNRAQVRGVLPAVSEWREWLDRLHVLELASQLST